MTLQLPAQSDRAIGTWIPLEDGRLLAERNGVLDKLRALFDYVPGNVSPPQAPKHTTNVNRAKPSKSSQPTKRAGCVIPPYCTQAMQSD